MVWDEVVLWIVVLWPGFGCFHIILGLFNCLVHGRNCITY